ncbi:MAG: hydrolase [Gammaproteobacteria bacterium]|jgi:hypothetical protein
MIDRLGAPAIRGIQRGLDGLRRTAEDIAAQPNPRTGSAVDPARSMVELQRHRQQVEANAKAGKAAYDTLGTLLDVRA